MSSTGMSKTAEIVLALLAYSCCSASLVLVNKLILYHLPYPSLVTMAQMIFAVLFIGGGSLTKMLTVDAIKWEYIKPYLYYTASFSFGIYCNMRTLAAANIETVIVFRAMSPLLVTVADTFFLGRAWPTKRSLAALSLIVIGAYLYAMGDKQFQTMGMAAYGWPTVYLFVISFEMAYGKKIVKSVPLKTKSGPVLYSNLLGWSPMIIFAMYGGEFDTMRTGIAESSLEGIFTPVSLALLLVGCIVGTGIGYSAWWCRDLVSATSFTVVGVMNKCITVLVNYMIWDQHASNSGIASLGLCLVGGVLYQQAPMARKGDTDEMTEEKVALISDAEKEHGEKV